MKKRDKEKKGKEKTDNKKAGKKKIILIGLLVAVIAAAGAFFFMTKGEGGGGKKTKAKLPDPVEAYTLGEESVASITAAIEEASGEVLLSVSTNVVSESEDEEEKDKKDKEDEEEEEKEEKEEKEQEEDAEEPAAEPESEWYYYCYRLSEESEDYIQQYQDFLQEEGFEPVTDASSFKEPVGQYAQAYQRECADQGHLFIIELECPMGGNEAAGLYGIKIRLEEKKKVTPVTREDTLKYFKTLDEKVLGLEKPIDDYSIMMDMGRTFVDGMECYGISLYEKGDGEESYFVKKFYLSLAEKKLFEYMGGDIMGLQQNSSVSDGEQGDANGTVHDWNFGPVE